PLKNQMPEGDRVIFTNLPEMFFTYIKTAFVGGIVISSPFIFHQLWLFIAPGLYQHEKRYLIPFVLSSSLLFLAGTLFAYFVVFPFGFKFFLGFANDYIQALPSVKQYFSFSIKLLLAFGLIFQLPVVVFFISKMGLLGPDTLKKNRKYALLLIFVIAAILTPPDVITQFMMAGPLLILYEISIWVSAIASRGKAKDKEDE
ncbi:MAG TPA: twin-arginine translocase subunit TatC, partial [Desulfobacteraceae bacterium]|nr:twin-arginine translocase subunit TatC [Desulfobacteraceae bacterium]